jgi:hypothetical protein
MFRNKTLKSPWEAMPKQQEMFDEWEKYGIEGGAMVLIDVEKCQVIDKNRQPEEIKNADPDARIESMKKNILIGLKENGFDPKDLKKDSKCSKIERAKYPDPTLDEIHQSLEEQTVKLLEKKMPQ